MLYLKRIRALDSISKKVVVFEKKTLSKIPGMGSYLVLGRIYVIFKDTYIIRTQLKDVWVF